jgi:hypothetical protein
MLKELLVGLAAIFDFKFLRGPYTIWLLPFNGERDISSRVASMRKFLELARKTLMEEITI